MYALSEDWQLTNKSKTNPFLSVMFAINLIAWPSLIPNFVVHRKQRWWLSNSLIRLWFLYSIHQVSWKIYVYTISHSVWRRTNWKTEEAAGIARKTHEIASLEQSFSQRPIDSTSNSLYKVPFAGHTRANSVRGRTL